MLTRRVFLRGSALVMAGVGAAPAWLARAAEATEGKEKDPGRDLSAWRGRRPEHRGAVFGKALLRIAAVHRVCRCPAGRTDRSTWTGISRFTLAAALEGAVGQAATRHRSSHRLARSVAVALRCAGLHGVGHARQDHGRRLAESRSDAGRSADFAGARDRRGRAVAAHAARQPRRDCGE